MESPKWDALPTETPATNSPAFAMDTAQPNRLQKSLQGVNCCFCEESLAYTLTGEKVVCLDCEDICHLECLLELVEPGETNDIASSMPYCGNCGEKSIPIDTSMHSIILKKAAETSPFSSSIYPPTSDPPHLPWSPLVSKPINNKLSTISNTSISSTSTRSHFSQSSVSSIDSADYKLDSAITSSQAIQEMSPAIPRPILDTRLANQPAPSIQLTPEFDTLASDPAHLSYMTVAVTVKTPPLPILETLSTTEERQEATLQAQKTVPNWKALDSSLFGSVRLCDTFSVSKGATWRTLECYLFDEILVFVCKYPNKPPQAKGSVAIKDHLKSIALPLNGKSNQLTLYLSTPNLPALHMKTTDPNVLENWYTALLDKSVAFPSHRLVPAASPKAVPTSTRLPVDTVILVPLSGSPHGSKFPSIRATLLALLAQAQLFDRIAIVPYGGGSQQYVYGLASGTWRPWTQVIESLNTTARAGSKTDLLCGLTTAFSVLSDRKTRNPLSSILVISDSLVEITDSSVEGVAARAASEQVAVHTFGVSSHAAEKLQAVSARCSGNYFYLRKWDELEVCVLGQYKALQATTHRDVAVRMGAAAGISIVDMAGHNPRGPTRDAIPESPPLTPGNSTHDLKLSRSVHLGDMMANEQRTFLVQTQVHPSSLKPVLNLFTVGVGASPPVSVSVLFEARKGSSPQFSVKSPLSRDFAYPFELSAEESLQPSLMYGHVLDAAGGQKCSVAVTRRRVQLVAISLFESIIKADLRQVGADRISKNIESARVILQRLQSNMITSSSSPPLDNSSTQVQQLVSALDSVMQTTMEQLNMVAVFEEDQRRYLVQSVGTLKSERGVTGRSELERLQGGRRYQL